MAHTLTRKLRIRPAGERVWDRLLVWHSVNFEPWGIVFIAFRIVTVAVFMVVDSGEGPKIIAKRCIATFCVTRLDLTVRLVIGSLLGWWMRVPALRCNSRRRRAVLAQCSRSGSESVLST